MGEWSLEQDLILPKPTQARFVRFTANDLKPNSTYELADSLSIIERPVDQDYYSILGEWGENERQASFEYFSAPTTTSVGNAQDNNEQANEATLLNPDQAISNQVTVQKTWIGIVLNRRNHAK